MNLQAYIKPWFILITLTRTSLIIPCYNNIILIYFYITNSSYNTIIYNTDKKELIINSSGN